jgi:hypothetical protein
MGEGMNLTKMEITMEAVRYWAKRLTDLELGCVRDLNHIEGGTRALAQLQTKIDQTHKAFYQAEVDAGRMTMDECKAAIRVVDRCLGSVISMRESAQAQCLTKQGELNSLRAVGGLLQQDHERKLGQLQSLQTAITDGSVRVEDDGGVRPQSAAVMDIAKRRRAVNQALAVLEDEPVAEAVPEPVAGAEAAPEPVAGAEAAPEPVAEAVPEPVAEAVPEPVAETAPEPVAEAVPEPVAEAVPEPVAEAAPEPVAGERPKTLAEKLARAKQRKRAGKKAGENGIAQNP